jgi:peptidoglycan/xylan/chitin deacetylase (PgdA/CDA1 family)
MASLQRTAVQLLRRSAKGAAAMLLHYSGARSLIASAQRKAVGGRRVLILSYHRVVKSMGSDDARTLPTLSITQDTFRGHLQQLAETHDIVSLDVALDVLAGSARPGRDLAVITFDDGYRGVHQYAFPVMKELGVPGVVYVPSGYVGSGKRLLHDRLWDVLVSLRERKLAPNAIGIGGAPLAILRKSVASGASLEAQLDSMIGEHPSGVLHELADALEERLGLKNLKVPEGHLNMTWEQLRELNAGGVAVGAHTVDHTVLTHEPLDKAVSELARCKATLEAGLKAKVTHFAYCNGWYSPGIAQGLKRLGYASAVTTEDIPNLPGVDPYALKRKVLWENASTGPLGGYSRAVTACQLDDVFGALSLQTPVLGARPTNLGDGSEAAAADSLTAHG